MASPLVSVLMPVRNAASFCEEAVRSIMVQTLEDFELVIVDDGSVDDSLVIIRELAHQDARIRVIAAGYEGLVAALNRGLAHCRGEYVARMDADDWSHPERLHDQCALLDRHPEISVVGCLAEAFPPHQAGEGFRIYLEWLNSLVTPEEIARDVYIESPIVHPTACMRREELQSLGAYVDRGWAEDYDLWLRYHAAGRRFAKVPRQLFRWREHAHRLTHTHGCYSIENFLRAKAAYLIRGPLSSHEELLIWGAGKTGRRLAKHLERGGRRPRWFIDISPKKIGGALRRVPVLGPDQLPLAWSRLRSPLLLVAVASRGARHLIRTHLNRLGLQETRHYFCVA